MSFEISLLPDAEQEYLEAFLWYEEQLDGLGETFILSVRSKLEQISANPHLFSETTEGVKCVKVDHTFPYIIIYSIDKVRNHVLVYSIFHTSRKPKKKYRKL
jgi:plasmid stabilization system protein ParE